VAIPTYALHGFNGMLTRDLAVYSYAGQQVADGVPPYLGILNRSGPLAHAIPGIGAGIARVAGFDDVLTLRWLFLAISVVCVCAVYVLGRDLFASRFAGLVSAATFLTFSGFIRYASDGPREKTPMTLFIVCALWAVTRRRWFTAGVFVSLAALCLQIAFFATFTAVVAGVLLLAHGERVRALLRVAVGGAVPALVCAVWFVVTDSWRQALEAFLLINIRYTTPDPVLPRLDEAWEGLQVAYGVSLWLLVGGLVALAIRSLAVVHRGARTGDPSVVVLAAFTLGVLAGLAWNVKEYDAWPDLFPLLPFAAVGIGGMFALLAKHVPPTAGAVTALALSVAGTTIAVHESVTTRDERLVTQRQSVTAVLAQAPAGATITSVEAPQALVLTRRTNPTRHQMFSAGLQNYIEDVWPGGLDGFRRGIVEDQPDLIVFGDPVSDRWRAAIEPEYVYVGKAPDWFWYARASLGEDRLSALRKAAGYDPTDEFARPPPPEPASP
jgi:4-amino-4-deoxy-L-arabinose transferase-like glycosyltransferase